MSKDWLPDGLSEKYYLKPDKEWRGLKRRIGKPRILNNPYFGEVLSWIKRKFKNHLNEFSYFEAGVGHGNDLRIFRKELNGKGRYLGVDISKAEIETGLKFYHEKKEEDTNKARELFALGDLRNLKKIKVWDPKTKNFSHLIKINDDEFDLIYMEAVLQGLGYGKKNYKDKKDSGQRMLDELYRICRKGGRFFGRASVFDDKITQTQRFDILRHSNNWGFIPQADEVKKMLEKAGFKIIKTSTVPHEKANKETVKQHILRMSFLVEK